MNDVKSLMKSFVYAFNGIKNAVLTERNFRIHMTAIFFVLYFAVPLIVFPFINALGAIGEIVTDLIENFFLCRHKFNTEECFNNLVESIVKTQSLEYPQI